MRSEALKYLTCAGVLGIGWFMALLIPRATREQLVPGFPHHPPASSWIWSALIQLILMCLVSILLAVIFKRAIVKARSLWLSSVLALVLPFVGTELFVLMKFQSRERSERGALK